MHLTVILEDLCLLIQKNSQLILKFQINEARVMAPGRENLNPKLIPANRMVGIRKIIMNDIYKFRKKC